MSVYAPHSLCPAAPAVTRHTPNPQIATRAPPNQAPLHSPPGAPPPVPPRRPAELLEHPLGEEHKEVKLLEQSMSMTCDQSGSMLAPATEDTFAALSATQGSWEGVTAGAVVPPPVRSLNSHTFAGNSGMRRVAALATETHRLFRGLRLKVGEVDGEAEIDRG